MQAFNRLVQQSFKLPEVAAQILDRQEVAKNKAAKQNKENLKVLGDHRASAPGISQTALNRTGQDFKASSTPASSKNSFSSFVASTSLGKLFSTNSKIGQLYAANQKEKADSKQIAVVQKEIDSLAKELKNELKNLKESKDEKTENEINKKIDYLVRRIELKANTIKSINASAKAFIYITQGKAKVVSMEWEAYQKEKKLNGKQLGKDEIPDVFYTPVGSNFIEKRSKKNEIAEEAELGEKFKAGLVKKGINPEEETNVAFKMDVQEKATDKMSMKEYTVKTPFAAGGDLDRDIGKNAPKFPQSARLGLDILKGMNHLHLAGFVHGDVKGDNVLIADQPNGEKIARITDLGKTREMGNDEKGINLGNPRYAAPEGGSSQRSEVYSTGLLIIHSLEKEFLNEENGYMIRPENNFVKDESVKVEAKRTGIEKFLVLNKNCPQTENTSFERKASILGREISQNIKAQMGINSNNKKAEVEVHAYIDALVRKLTQNNPQSAKEINELGNLLKDMTRSKLSGSGPVRTENLQVALTEYQRIMDSLK